MLNPAMRFSTLAQSTFVSLETYRQTGAAVAVPVWIVAGIGADSEKLFCWTRVDSGKIKRIRANPRVRLAPCDVAGKITGEWVCANARVLTREDDIKAQAARMRRKFGLKFLPFRYLPSLRGTKPAVVEICLDD